MAPIQGITTISFDADGTLFDFKAVMRRSLALALEALERELPGSRERLSVDALIELRKAVASDPWALGRTHEEVREESFRRAIAQLGGAGPGMHELAADITALYMQHRFGDIELYPDVRPAIEALKGRYRLGMTSNGNSYPERCGLPGVFSFVVLSQEHGIRKPDPGLYRIALRNAGCHPWQMLHVGDSWIEDVVGAQSAGIRCAWLNRSGDPHPSNAVPDLEIASLSELAALLHGG